MVSGNFLSPGEVDIIETAKAKKKLKEERKQLAKSKEELKGEKTFGKKVIEKEGREFKKGFKKFKQSFFKVKTKPKYKVFGSAPVQEDFTKEQNILRGMFGHGERVLTNFDGRSLPKIYNNLNSGCGLLKSGDTGETMGMFGKGAPSGFFGGKGRY